MIVDFKRPMDRLGRMLTALTLHATMRTGTQELPALLAAVGFTAIEAGTIRFKMIGFVRGRTKA